MAKTTYMIVAGASVVIVRDGKRVPIAAGGGADFTDDEIAAIKKATPGALRKPINEGRGKSKVEDDESEDDADEGKTAKTTAKTGKSKGKAKAPKASAEKPAADADDGDDGDEDEDI